jgi:hypothetical protein
MKFWTVCLIIVMILNNVGAITFPVAPLGHCYDGVKALMEENAYPGARIAYFEPTSDSPSGHVELILQNGTEIDSHYGVLPKMYQQKPDKVFDNMTELDNYVTIQF